MAFLDHCRELTLNRATSASYFSNAQSAKYFSVLLVLTFENERSSSHIDIKAETFLGLKIKLLNLFKSSVLLYYLGGKMYLFMHDLFIPKYTL